MFRPYIRYVDHLWYPILIPSGGGHRIVEMLGADVNAWNDRLHRQYPVRIPMGCV